MNNLHKHINVIVAEDDEDDYLLIAEALNELDNIDSIHWVKDGEELLNHLERCEEAGNSQEKTPAL